MSNLAISNQAKVAVPSSAGRDGLLQRRCACGTHTTGGGECAECSKMKLQRKLSIGATDDPLELEADRVADQVMAAPAHPVVNATPQRIQRFSGHSNGQMDAAPASVDRALASPGRPLEPALRQDLEQRFGYDFAGVRVHADAAAEQSARDVNARAYAVGQHVVFGHEQYAPHTVDGRHLLAHELTHTLQQEGGVPSLRRDPPKSPPSARPDLETRLKIIEETGPTIGSRLDQIIRTGGPMPDTTDGAKVIGAAIIDVEGYQGPKEMRSINGLSGDSVGQGAPVYHATSPTNRTLSATQGPRTPRGGNEPSIRGPRRESINSHVNDAEIKLFEDIISRLPKGAKGTIHFTTMRVLKGQTVPEPIPACSGCIRASFETAGLPDIDLVSHAVVHPPMSVGDLGDSHVGAGGPGKPPAPGGGSPAKPTTPGESEPAGAPVQVKGTGGKSGTATDVDAPAPAAPGRTGAAPKTTVPTPRTGVGTEVAISIGTGVATVGLGWLAAYLKARVDQKIAQRQIDAFMEVARKKINTNPDGALKKMMLDPYVQVYAWVHLESSVITTFGVDPNAPEPVMTDSAPIFDLGPIEFMTAPMDPSLADSLPKIGGGGRHLTTVRTIIVDVPITTPPLETLIAYAKARNLPLDDLQAYVMGRYQAALSSDQVVLDAHQKIWEAYTTTNEIFQRLQAEFQKAKDRNDVELQKSLAEKLVSIGHSLKSISEGFEPSRERIQGADQKVKYWQNILELLKPTPKIQQAPPPTSSHPAPPPSNAHPTPPGVKLPKAAPAQFPTVEEQQSTVCPNCHRQNESKPKDILGPSGGLRDLSDADRKALLEWIK